MSTHTVKQSGSVTPGHMAVFTTEGVISDGGNVDASLVVVAVTTVAAAIASTIGSADTYLQVQGYATIGDGGAGLYKKVGSAPAHSGYFQSADGAYWELQGPVVTLENFGAKGDGATDDATAVINAFNSHVVIGAKLVGRPNATYKIVGAGPSMIFSDVQFDGNYCTFEFSAIAANGIGFDFFLAGVGSTTTFSADVAAGDTTLHLTAAVLSTGDLFILYGTSLAGTAHFFEGIVKSASGTTVTLEAAIPPGLSITIATETYAIVSYTPGINSIFKNCTINGTSCVNSGLVGLKLFGCAYDMLENITFNGWGTTDSGALSISQSVYITVRNIYALKSGSAGLSDITFDMSNSTVDGVLSEQATGFGPHITYGAYSTYKNIASFKASGRGIKTSGCLASNFDALTCSNTLTEENNVAIANGTSYCNFNNIVSIQAPGTPGGGACIWLSDQDNSYNRFTNILAMFSGWYDVYTGASDLYNSFDQVLCTGFPPSTYLFDGSGTTQWGIVNGTPYNPHHVMTLANGVNNNVSTSFVSDFARIAGPTGGFTITGLGVAADGTPLTILNPIAQNMTLANASGSSSAGNRILTLTGSDVTLTGVSAVILRYSLLDTSWVIVGTNG